MSNEEHHDNSAYFPIRTVAAETGVNPITLRAWERRYGLVKPHRTPKGHRLYTAADIDTIKQILAMLDRGVTISRVKPLLEGQPADLEAKEQDDSPQWAVFHQNLVQALTVPQFNKVASVYQKALKHYPAEVVIRYLLLPVLKQLEQSEATAHTLAVFEAFFQQAVMGRLGELQAKTIGPKVLFVCPQGQKTNDLLVCLLLHQLGISPLLVNKPLDLAEASNAADHLRCDALVFSTFDPTDCKLMETTAQRFARPIFVWTEKAKKNDCLALGVVPLHDDSVKAAQNVADVLTLA